MRYLLLAMLFAGCSFVQKSSEPVPSPLPSPEPTDPAPQPHLLYWPGDSLTDSDKAKIANVQKLINEAAQSECFHDFFTNPLKTSHLVQTNGKTAEEVVAQIKQASQAITIETYYSYALVLGYRQPGEINTIHLNRRYFTLDGYSDDCTTASTVFHETTHLPFLGYDHDFNRTPRRPFSVPYRINRMMEACCAPSLP